MGENLLPYGRQWIDEADVEALSQAAVADLITQGPRVAQFERALGEYCDAPYVVAVSSGTAALHLAALAAGLGPGDRAVTSPITFVASSNCILYCGAEPAWVDIDPVTRNLSPEALGRTIAAGQRPKAVIAVHYAGLPAPMVEIAALARAAGAVIIEDACHALGAEYREGLMWHRVGSCAHADMACFSFHPVKHITTGEGGAITTRSGALYERLLRLRSHGITRDPALLGEQQGPWYYEMQELGWNYRITDLQCALGLSQLRKLPEFVARRRAVAEQYRAALSGLAGVALPTEPDGFRSSHHLFPIWFDEELLGRSRGAIFDHLTRLGLGVQVHYIPVHLQPYYRRRFGTRAGQFPAAERFYRGAISIPLFPRMREEDVERVVRAVEEVVR